jgi:hypothetical protein
MLALYGSILLVSVRTRNTMRNPYTSKEGIEFLVLTTLVGLHAQDLAIKGSINKPLKHMKDLKNFGFVANEINPWEFAEIINKASIIIFLPI